MNVVHYASVEQPEIWVSLLEAPSLAPPIPNGNIADLSSTEAIQGLHLIRFGDLLFEELLQTVG